MVRRNPDIPKSPVALLSHPVPMGDALDEGPYFHRTKAGDPTRSSAARSDSVSSAR